MMKKRNVGLCVAAIAFMAFSAVFSNAQSLQETTKDKLVRLAKILAGPGAPAATRAKIEDAVIELLDVVAVLTPENQYRKDILYRIDVAKDLIRKQTLFDDKARQYLSLAYRQMTSGVKFEQPKELQEFVTPAELQEKILKYMKNLFDKAQSALAAGHDAETAKTRLEIVLAIMTPVSG
jgi:hypothetical protein